MIFFHNSLITLCAIFCLADSANAGDFLRLKAVGAIKLDDHSTALLKKGLLSQDTSLKHFVIQFKEHISEADKQSLILQGIALEQYFPEDTLLVRATESTVAVAKLSSDRIRAIARFAAEWKISPEFWNEPAVFSVQETELILISILEGSSARNTARLLETLPGVQVQWAKERDILVTAPKNHIANIANIDAVEWIQRAPVFVNFLFSPDGDVNSAPSVPTQTLDVTGYESGTKLMGFEAAWNRGFAGEGQIATVADTGLDSGNLATVHPDFQDTLLKGYLMGLGTETWEDSMGHGTHVCGSVAGTGRSSDGAFKGGAHKSKLIIEGLWSAILDNLAPGSDVKNMLGTVYKDGSRIHSNSWGNPRNLGEYDIFAVRMDEFMWNNPEMLVLFAAGNSGEDKNGDGHVDEGSISSPGTAKNVLTVGASENVLATGGIQKPLRELKGGDLKWGIEPLASDKLSDNAMGMAAFSSRGPTSDGRMKPEIVAPGTNIVSTRSHHPKASKLWGEYDANYAYGGGTSMATPLTAGAATVAREFLVKARGIAAPSAALVKALLMHTATDLFPGQYGTGAGQELAKHRPNVHEGYGRVNMDTATALAEETLLIDEKGGVGLSETKTINVTLVTQGALQATLCYTDAPASASASKALVNDIDLKITGPNGQVFQKQDRINNTEMLEVGDLAPGVYTISVTGINVPQGKNGKQPYALILSQH